MLMQTTSTHTYLPYSVTLRTWRTSSKACSRPLWMNSRFTSSTSSRTASDCLLLLITTSPFPDKASATPVPKSHRYGCAFSRRHGPNLSDHTEKPKPCLLKMHYKKSSAFQHTHSRSKGLTGNSKLLSNPTSLKDVAYCLLPKLTRNNSRATYSLGKSSISRGSSAYKTDNSTSWSAPTTSLLSRVRNCFLSKAKLPRNCNSTSDRTKTWSMSLQDRFTTSSTFAPWAISSRDALHALNSSNFQKKGKQSTLEWKYKARNR